MNARTAKPAHIVNAQSPLTVMSAGRKELTDIEESEYRALLKGKDRPTIELIEIGKLKVDPEYQRFLIPAHVKRITRQFDIDAIGVPAVSRRANGQVVVIDGQHRKVVADSLGLGNLKVYCEVYAGLSKQQEAALFLLLNNTKKTSSWDAYKAGLVAKDPVCLNIRRIAEQAGWQIGQQTRDHNLSCVAALRKIYEKKGGGEALLYALQDSGEAWGFVAASADAQIVQGLANLHLIYRQEVDRKSLVNKLAKYSGGPSGILGQAKAMKAIRSSSVVVLVTAVVVALYNKGRRTNPLADMLA